MAACGSSAIRSRSISIKRWARGPAAKSLENISMSAIEQIRKNAPVAAMSESTARRPRNRTLLKRTTHLIRRGHLYLGLFLLPWAILYGFTGFLFNHPFSFRGTPNATYRRDALVGTPMENPPSPTELARQVVARLNEQQQPEQPYQLVGEGTYGPRGVAFVTVKYKDLVDQVLSVSFDLAHSAGGIHYEANREPKPVRPAPFAAGPVVSPGRTARGGGGAEGGGRRDGGSSTAGPKAAIKFDDRLEDRLLAAVPVVLERTGFPPADSMVVTAIPNLTFTIDSGGERWNAAYNPLSGGVGGIPEGAEPKTEMGWRRFLTQLHLAHVYPYDLNARWFWSLIVDAMAFTMIFWSLSGLVMWWQIKATRPLGAVILVLSALSTVALGFAMHAVMTS
ncbi:MAG: hypothetical protein C0478_16250 [Planctomyces sp.]|nr:hypothetical protein [Planctomyces sp.]